MIPRAAVKRYLARPLESHLWIKRVDKDDLLKQIKALIPKARQLSELFVHQLACFLLGVAFPRFSFWLDMGLGKTRLSLELLRYWWDAGEIRRALIFVISDKAFRTWEKQIKRFNIEIPYVMLQGSSVEKWTQLRSMDEGMVIVSYAGAVAMASELVALEKGGREMELVPERVEALREWCDAMVLDESTKAGHHTSLTYKLVDKLRPTARIRYALAGRPFGRDPTMLYNQQHLIDDGESFGTTLGMFRYAFFDAKENYWAKKRGGHRGKFAKDYKFNKQFLPIVRQMAEHRSISYSSKECQDLPPEIPVIEEVSFSEEAEVHYRKAIKEIIAARGNMREMDNVFLRMRQMASGFIGFRDDETGEKVQYEFAENPKLDCLLELVEQLPEDCKAIIFYEFTPSGKRIFKELKDRDFDPIWLWSGTKDAYAEQERFQNDPRARVALLQSQVGAFSLDGMQEVANYVFFFESPVSPITREQAERRLVRTGQKRTVWRYDIICRGSPDAKIREFHAEGDDLMKAIFRDPGKIFGKG